MPRGKGGKRQGAPGASYQNRSDLQQAPRAVPGQPYGVAGQQLQAQAQMPLPTQNMTGGPPAPPPGPMPGELPPLHAPTTRPGEPLTAGLPTGPGPGPEVLTPPDPLIKAAAVLNALGDAADPQTRQLRILVNATLHNQGAA